MIRMASRILLHAFVARQAAHGIEIDMGQPCERLHIDMQGGCKASCRNDRRGDLRGPQGP